MNTDLVFDTTYGKLWIGCWRHAEVVSCVDLRDISCTHPQYLDSSGNLEDLGERELGIFVSTEDSSRLGRGGGMLVVKW